MPGPKSCACGEFDLIGHQFAGRNLDTFPLHLMKAHALGDSPQARAYHHGAVFIHHELLGDQAHARDPS
jgi:hypothetical protein